MQLATISHPSNARTFSCHHQLAFATSDWIMCFELELRREFEVAEKITAGKLVTQEPRRQRTFRLPRYGRARRRGTCSNALIQSYRFDESALRSAQFPCVKGSLGWQRSTAGC